MHTVLYFGCIGQLGHYLWQSNKFDRHIDTDKFPTFPWKINHLDTGLLDNGKHVDKCDGKVFWTCGGAKERWFAFFWWDRSVDTRPGSNSGLYVSGFEFSQRDAAFDYACKVFPEVIQRQVYPLIVQG
jgi:hypothetical protein